MTEVGASGTPGALGTGVTESDASDHSDGPAAFTARTLKVYGSSFLISSLILKSVFLSPDIGVSLSFC